MTAVVAVFRNPYTGTVLRVTGTNIAAVTSWGWTRLDDGPPAPAYDPFPQYITAAELTAALAGFSGGGGGGVGLTDNGDGTFALSGTAVADNGDGTYTIAA